MRRILRFNLKTLLLLPALFAAWFWATWPDRTFTRYLSALENAKPEIAQAMLTCNDGNFAIDARGIRYESAAIKRALHEKRDYAYEFSTNSILRLVLRQERSVADAIRSRRVFFLPSCHGEGAPDIIFVVTCGEIQVELLNVPQEQYETAEPFGETSVAFWNDYWKRWPR